MRNNSKQISQLIFSILIFSIGFIYFIKSSENNENKLQVSPEKYFYKEKFGEETSYDSRDNSEKDFIKNIRINNTSGVSEPKIICSPINNNILAVSANDFSDNENTGKLFLSEDKGINWSEKKIPLSSKFKRSSYTDPWIDFDYDGNLIFIAVQKNLMNINSEGLYFTRSTNLGDTWISDLPFVDFNGKENIHLDRPRFLAGKTSEDKNIIYVTWTELKGINSYVMFSKSINGGVYFDNPMEIEKSDAGFGTILKNTSSDLSIVYLKNETDIRIKKSTDNGASWNSEASSVKIIPAGIKTNGQYLIKSISGNGIRINSEPSAIILKNKDIVMTYNSKGEENDIADVYFCRFINNKSEFTKPVKVNTDNATSDQFLPVMTIDSSENIFIIYQDSRNDNKNILTDTYLSLSADGGITFTDRKISLKSFNPVNVSVQNYIGDYNSCVISGFDLISSWTDGRNNNLDIYAGIFNFKDIINMLNQ